jgi:hypothetical protein
MLGRSAVLLQKTSWDINVLVELEFTESARRLLRDNTVHKRQ